jgi:hypothetical protein
MAYTPNERIVRAQCAEIALAELRRLTSGEAHRLVSDWLTSIGLQAVGLRECARSSTTYQATLGEDPARGLVLIRTYRRRNRLQELHVDAFRGYIQRSGAAFGILVTAGAFSPEALRAAADRVSPPVRLIAGSEWLGQLLALPKSILRRRACRCVLDLAPRTHPTARRRGGL